MQMSISATLYASVPDIDVVAIDSHKAFWRDPLHNMSYALLVRDSGDQRGALALDTVKTLHLSLIDSVSRLFVFAYRCS